MKAMLNCLLAASLAALGFIAPAAAQDLPPAAREAVDSAKRDTEAWESIKAKAEDEIKQRNARLAKQLADLIQQLRAQGRNAEAEQIVRYVAGQDAAPVASAKVEVEWQGFWYPAVVLKREGNRTYIQYDGYGEEWNEWVGPERIRGLEGNPAATPAGGLVVGSAVDILWSGTWFPGKLLSIEKDGRYHISYDNYGPEWNEVVGPDRIRAKPGAAPAANRIPVGSSVDIEWQGSWYPGKVLKAEDNRWFISYDGYSELWHEWVGPERIRAKTGGAAATRFDVGASVDVEWHGTWYPSKVLKAEENRWYIKYDRDTELWNEWVGPTRIRARGGEVAKPDLGAGSKVDIQWGGTWWPGEILKVDNGRFFIHYDNHADSWDEWVGPDRVRARLAQPAANPYRIFRLYGGEARDEYIVPGRSLPLIRYSSRLGK